MLGGRAVLDDAISGEDALNALERVDEVEHERIPRALVGEADVHGSRDRCGAIGGNGEREVVAQVTDLRRPASGQLPGDPWGRQGRRRAVASGECQGRADDECGVTRKS